MERGRWAQIWYNQFKVELKYLYAFEVLGFPTQVDFTCPLRAKKIEFKLNFLFYNITARWPENSSTGRRLLDWVCFNWISDLVTN